MIEEFNVDSTAECD